MKMNKSNFVRTFAEIPVEDLRVANAEDGVFSGYEADNFAAYVRFKLCHTLPGVVLGPLSNSGEYMGFIGSSLRDSIASLRNKPFNFRHLMKHNAKNKSGGKDHIIGSIVDAAMPSEPEGGWWSPENTSGAPTFVECIAVVWKHADQVPEILGRHINGEEKQSVSIEVVDRSTNLKVFRPSTGEAFGYDELPEAWAPALKTVKGQARPFASKLDGEQLVVIYGANGQKMQFRAVAMTPNPAEKIAGTSTPAAEITDVMAEDEAVEAVASELVPILFKGSQIRFDTGALGVVRDVRFTGKHLLHKAVDGNPVCIVRVAGRDMSIMFSDAVKKIA
jgi:hypothetical protein